MAIGRKLALILAALAGFVSFGWEKAIPPEKAIPRLEAALQVAAQMLASGLDINALGLQLHDGYIQVVVEAEFLAEKDIASLGGKIRYSAAEFGLWEVLIPPDNLPALAGLSGVKFVRRPASPVAMQISEGLVLSGANRWHAAGLYGRGIKVAVIDLEFGGLSQAIAQGRLRNVIFARDYTAQGLESSGSHGVACAELVQAIAPAAELILLKIDTEVQLYQAVMDALALGARVFTHSAAWFNTNFYDGTGVVCQIVRLAWENGAIWVNAAGNHANGPHWEGQWRDDDGDGLLNFAPAMNVNTFTVSKLQPLAVCLTWDGWPTTDVDLDLYIVHMPTEQVVASSTNLQTGQQPPTEMAFFVPTSPGTYGIVVRRHAIRGNPRLEIFCSGDIRLSFFVAESSIVTPADSPYALAAGAINAGRWATGPKAPYSSQGPTNVSRLNPVAHTKPDIMGPDEVSTWSYGERGFFGTSAAAPQVAGAAALVWSANPTWSASAVRTWLEQNALGMGAPGKDNLYGFGRLNLPAPQAPGPVGTVHTYGGRAGWYLVSVPTTADTAAIFGVTLYHWNGTNYERLSGPAPIEPLRGYWAHLPANKTVTATGTIPTTNQTLTLGRTGWHMISAPWRYPKTAIQVVRGPETRSWAEAVVAGWVRDDILEYVAQPQRPYASATVLEPWYGYWMRAQVDRLSLRFVYASRITTLGVSGGEATVPKVEELPPGPPAAINAWEFKFVNVPNPVRDVHTTTFKVLGPLSHLVGEMKVQVFDLSGRLVWEGVAFGPELTWDTADLTGKFLANGVYIYQVFLRIDGEWVNSPVMLLAILR